MLRFPFVSLHDYEAENYGGYALGRWSHTFSSTSDLRLQFYYDLSEVRSKIADWAVHTLDADLQHRFQLGERHEITWGGSVRFHQYGEIETAVTLVEVPDVNNDTLLTAFVQDSITLVGDRFHLIFGSKFEHNDYTGFEIQPNARLLWTPEENKSVWAAVSRAVRTPSSAEELAHINQWSFLSGIPALFDFKTNGGFDSEDVLAYELGTRFQAYPSLWIDLAGFYNIYDELRSAEFGEPRFEPLPFPHLVIPGTFSNKLRGNTYGFELASEWDASKWLRFKAAYTFLIMDLEAESDSRDTSADIQEDMNPKHQLSLRCLMDLPHDVKLDLWLRYVDSIPASDIDSYVAGDVRVAWKVSKNLEASIVGRNLFSDHHSEFKSSLLLYSSPTDVERSVYGKLTWEF